MKYQINYRIWNMDVVKGMERKVHEFKASNDKEAINVLLQFRVKLVGDISQLSIQAFYIDSIFEETSNRLRVLYDAPGLGAQ